MENKVMLQMGNCLKSNNNATQSQKTNDIIISIIGLDDSGKTTTAKVLKGDKDYKDTSPTVGYEPHQLKYNSRSVTLYDLGGGQRVRDIWKHYLSESFGFIFVIDASNRNRIAECGNVFASFIENEKVIAKPILIYANKQDLPNALDESEIVQYLNVEELVNRFQIPCRIETCSAFSGVGNKQDKSIQFGFDWLMKHIIFNFDELKTRIDFDVERQKLEESKQRKERSERLKKNSNSTYYEEEEIDMKNEGNPWKALNDLNKQKDNKTKATSSSKSTSSNMNGEPKMSAYDLDEMRAPSPKQRLTTISEDMEKSKMKNKFLKVANNKLSPYDEIETKKSDPFNTKQNKTSSASWAIVDTSNGHSGMIMA